MSPDSCLFFLVGSYSIPWWFFFAPLTVSSLLGSGQEVIGGEASGVLGGLGLEVTMG